jgi:D-glycero-alpha-D-manno-heptose 1-phosphate guanylyltransferase
MQTKQCIILAGGLGTRLRSEVADLPKCMAPVAGKPFLYWVIRYLQSQGISSFIFSLGYLHQIIEAYIATEFPELAVTFSVEEEPLGTGGAIKLAMKLCSENNVLVINGDTLFEADVKALTNLHTSKNAACTLALKPMQDFDRYGSVEIDSNNCIRSFNEKKFVENGLINGGIYLINRLAFLDITFATKFSFEKDYLEKHIATQKIYGLKDEGYFIDIGIPEDFKKANIDIKDKYDSIK